MFLRYCKEDEVIEKNQIFLIFKGAFLAKMKQIDSNGQNQTMLTKISSWVDDNWEQMYEEMMEKQKDYVDLSDIR